MAAHSARNRHRTKTGELNRQDTKSSQGRREKGKTLNRQGAKFAKEEERKREN
jgi:hypothetical protein